ncbi:MAG TPA: IclR family transcriptional regulator [Thermodesulfobacteriota bacterium]
MRTMGHAISAPTQQGRARDDELRSVARAIDILMLFDAGRPLLGVTEVAQSLGVSKSTAHRLLQLLGDRGFVAQDTQSRRYRLGLTLLRLGRLVAEGLDLRREALPVMRRLQERTGETVDLNVERDGYRICLEKIEGQQAIRQFVEIGRPLPLHAGASGKVLLAHLPPARIERILAGPLPRFTRRTVTDPRRLGRQLQEIREQGYACSVDERIDGASSASAPIRDATGTVVAGLTVSGPTFRIGPEQLRQFAVLVREAASEVSTALGCPEGSRPSIGGRSRRAAI